MWMIEGIFLMMFLSPIMFLLGHPSKKGKEEVSEKKREQALSDDGFEWEIIRKPGKDKKN